MKGLFCAAVVLAVSQVPAFASDWVEDDPKPTKPVLQGSASRNDNLINTQHSTLEETPGSGYQQLPAQGLMMTGSSYDSVIERDVHGVPRLPQWKTVPDWRVEQKHVAKWRGFRPRKCTILMTPLADGSHGVFFTTLGLPTGPRGWIMPLPKGPEDKWTPWALYFDQQDAP